MRGRVTESVLVDRGTDWISCRFIRLRRMALSASPRFITVKVKPNARASSLRAAEGGLWLAELKAPPVDGKANAELIRLVARHFGCPRSAVVIKTGGSSRTKLVKIESE